MSIIDEILPQLTQEELAKLGEIRSHIEGLVKRTWNNAMDRAADVASRSYYEDDGGFSPMAPSTISEKVLELKK